MLNLKCKIIIESDQKWEFTACNALEIIENVENLTNTCALSLPRKITWVGAEGRNPPIRRGDKIKVYLGYDNNLSLRFAGFIRTVNTKTPIKIECENNMFLLKGRSIHKKSFRKASLKEVITYLLQDTGMEFRLMDDSILLGNYTIKKNTVAEQLAELKKEFGLSAYFRSMPKEEIQLVASQPKEEDSYLYVGFTYPFDGNIECFAHTKNLIQEELQYRQKEDISLKVKAISVQEDGSKIEVEVGDKEGELRTIYRYNISKNELEKFALVELERFKYSGYTGNFLTFGEPVVRKTDIVKLKTENGEEGKHLVKSVTVTFGTDGYRQKIELGPTL